MSTDFMQQITDAYKTLNSASKSYDTLLSELNSRTSPEPPVVVSSVEQWQSYIDSVEAYKKYVEETNSALLMYKGAHEDARCQILDVIPAKAVWFKLSGLTVWIAKVSNNLMDKDGRNLLISTQESDLSPLTTL